MPAFGGFGTANTTTPSFPNDFKPIEVPGSPDDTVSQLRFCPKVQNGQTFFCASSWANDIRLLTLFLKSQFLLLKYNKNISKLFMVL